MDALSIMERLEALPKQIGDAEERLAGAERQVEDGERFLKELKESLEMAEGNAALNASVEGLTNQKARDMAIKAAVTNDEHVIAFKARLAKAQSEQVSLDFARRQARGKLSALRAEMDSLGVIANLMVGKMALECAKLENGTALLQLQAAQAQNYNLNEGVK